MKYDILDIHIFDMDKRYEECNNDFYTRANLIKILELTEKDYKPSEYEYKATIKRCAELCPMTFAGKPYPKAPKAPKERFEYLQFLHYMIERNRRCKENGYSVFDCITTPSERYLSLYVEMMGEIQEKVSEAAQSIAIGSRSAEFEPTQYEKIGYDDSLHALHQFADTIAQTLIYAYNFGDEALNILADRELLFYGEMERLKKECYPKVLLESWWDELFLRLSYAKCMYWESDLLWAYQQVSQMASKLSSIDTEYLTNEGLGPDNDCFLVLDSNRKMIQEIYEKDIMARFPTLSENEAFDIYMKDYEDTVHNVQNIDPYIEALGEYIRCHVKEITELVFRGTDATKARQNQILNRIPKVCEYLRMERQRYGRSCNFTKSKLICAYLGYFFLLTQPDIAPIKSGTVKAMTPRGLLREKNSLTSSYSNSSEKDPRFLQLICLWTDYLFMGNEAGAFFAKKWVDCNIAVLEAILTVGYQSGIGDIQLHAEKVLWATMESLIPDEDGETQLGHYIQALSKHGYRFGVGDSSTASLLKFGKFYKLFGSDDIISLIKKELEMKKQKLLYLIDLKGATDNAFQIYSPTLRISYCRTKDMYMLCSFFLQNWKILAL